MPWPVSGGGAPAPQPWWTRWTDRPLWQVIGHYTAIVVVAVVVGLVAVGVGSRTSGEVGPGRVIVEASVVPRGRTHLELPPLGRVTARTPSAPVSLTARVDVVDVDQLQDLLTSADPEARLTAAISRDLTPLLRRMAVRALVVATGAGALAALVLPGRRWWHAAAGGLAAGVVVAALGAVAVQRFDADAFRQPTFTGPLERAPAIIETAQRHVEGLQGVENRVEVLGQQLADLYAATEAVNVGSSADETRLLHVSDVHSNPLGAELVVRLADSFAVSAVLDTGDLTSFGYPIESRLGDLVRRVGVPYLFVPGNHDSHGNKQAIADLPNVELLDGTTRTIGGVEILGFADPTFTATNEIDANAAAAIKRERAPAVADATRRARPDVLAVHDPVLAEESFGRVPLIVAGHIHKRTDEVRDGTRQLTVGSSGASGLGTFTVETNHPYEAQVLHFQDGVLVALDYLSVEGISGNLTIERTYFGPDDPERPDDEDDDGST